MDPPLIHRDEATAPGRETRMSSERRRAMEGPSARTVGAVAEVRGLDEGERISGGGLSFGDFSLATQRKVTRHSPQGGRNPYAAQPHQSASHR